MDIGKSWTEVVISTIRTSASESVERIQEPFKKYGISPCTIDTSWRRSQLRLRISQKSHISKVNVLHWEVEAGIEIILFPS